MTRTGWTTGNGCAGRAASSAGLQSERRLATGGENMGGLNARARHQIVNVQVLGSAKSRRRRHVFPRTRRGHRVRWDVSASRPEGDERLNDCPSAASVGPRVAARGPRRIQELQALPGRASHRLADHTESTAAVLEHQYEGATAHRWTSTHAHRRPTPQGAPLRPLATGRGRGRRASSGNAIDTPGAPCDDGWNGWQTSSTSGPRRAPSDRFCRATKDAGAVTK